MPAHVEQEHRQPIGVEPVIPERVPPKLHGRDEPPVGLHRARHRRREQRAHVGRRLRQFARERLLAHRQRLVRLRALHLRDEALGVMADPRDQLDGVRELDDVVVGAKGEGLGLRLRFLLARQHDHRHVLRGRVRPQEPEQREPVEVGHHEVEQQDRRTHLGRTLERGRGLAAVVEIDVGLAGEHATHRLADHRLVVDEQHAHPVVPRRRESRQHLTGHGLISAGPAWAANRATASPMCSRDRTRLAAFSSTAAFGMP